MNTMRHHREIIAYVFFGVLTVLLNCILYILPEIFIKPKFEAH